MYSKNNKKMLVQKERERINYYGIKKFKIGAASVLIGAAFAFLGGFVQANDTTNVVNKSGIVQVNKSEETTSNKNLSEKEGVVEEKMAASTKENVKASEVKVDKVKLAKVIALLEETLKKAEASEETTVILEKSKEKLDKAKLLEKNAEATQEEVDKSAEDLKETLEKLEKKLLEIKEKTQKNLKQNDSEVKSNNEKLDKVESDLDKKEKSTVETADLDEKLETTEDKTPLAKKSAQVEAKPVIDKKTTKVEMKTIAEKIAKGIEAKHSTDEKSEFPKQEVAIPVRRGKEEEGKQLDTTQPKVEKLPEENKQNSASLNKNERGYSGFRIANYAARSTDRSVDGSLDSGTISGEGVKQFENLHYSIDGDRTVWRLSVRPAHKNHAWAGIAVTSDDTIENIRVVERGGAGGNAIEEKEISRGRPASTPFSNYKMFIGHYRLIGGGVPDKIVYEVTTRGTHHNLFSRFATAIVQNTLENSGLNGKAAITSRNSDFPEVGIKVNAVDAPTVNHNYTRTNDTVRMQTVPSTDNQLSGTGKPGATISVKKNGNTFKTTKVDGSGHWVVTLDAGLNSNLSDTGDQLVPKDKITVTQNVDGKESEATNVDVSLGRSWLDHSPGHPVGEITSNQRDLKLFVPHDAGMAYLRYRDTNNQDHEIGIRRTAINQQWHSLQSNLATVTSVDNTSNKFYSIINLRLNSDMKVGSQTSVTSNMKEGGYGSLEGWKSVTVVEAPLISGAHIESDLTGKASIPADVRVKAPVGSTVKLYDNNDVLIGEAVAGNDGYATVHPRNSLPEGQIRATSTPAGGKESAKSDPVTVTRTQVGHGGPKQLSSEGKARATIGVDKEWVTAYRGDYVEVNVSTYAKYLEKFLPNPNTRGNVKGLEESGGFLVTAQSTPETSRTGKTSGTIAMDQPLGPTVLNYYVVSKTTTSNYGRQNAGSSANVSTTITVLEVAKKYDISIDKKITVDNPNAVSAPEKEKIIAAIKEKNNRTYTDAAYRALLDQATYSVDEKGNVTITYPDRSVDKVASSYTIQKRPVIETSLIDKADTQTPITVSADPGSKVKLYDHSGHELGEGTANGNGQVTINPTRPIPNGNVTAKATDNRDNTTDASVAKQATVPAPQNVVIQQPNHGSTSVTITPQGRTDIITAVIQGKKVKIEKEGSGRYKTLENAANVRISPNSNGSVTFELPSGTRFETLDRIQATAENKDITVASGIRSSQEANQYVLHNRGEKVPVKDINRLTPADKERVKTAYEKVNPGINKSEVTVENNGNITYNHQGRGSIQKGNATLPDNVVLDNIAPGKPTIETSLLGKVGTRTPITVQAEAGAKVELFDSKNRKIGEKVADNQGRVTIEPTADLPAGNITAKATDEAGNISQPSDPKQVTYPLTNQPIINIKQGENLTAAEIKQTVLLQNANGTTNLPNNAQVTGNFDTSSAGDKRTTVTVTFPDAPAQQVEVTYRVLPTFPIAHTVYDFKGMDHGNSESGYYVNTGNLPSGMVWRVQRQGEQEQSASNLRNMLKEDPVGTKTYTFSGKFNHGRFTNNPSDTQKLAHTGTFEHKVFDVEANRTRVTVSNGATLTEQNAKDAVAKVAGSENLPAGTTYEWVDNHGNKQTPVANTPGVHDYRVKVTLPMSQTGTNQPDATQKRPSKIIDVKVNVKPEVPTYNTTINPKGSILVPTVASTDRELTGTGHPGAKIKVTVPGVTINEVTVGDNGKWRVSLPKGLNSNQTNQPQLVPQDSVAITQSVDGVESDATNVPVSLGETTIQPSEERGSSLFAGAKNIVVKVPHDAGMVYVSYTDKATGKIHEIGLKRENINSPWVSTTPTLGEVKTITKDAFTNNVTIEMKESIAEGTAKAIANISERKYSSAVDWKTIQVTNQAPTITSVVSGNEKIVEFGENIDLKTLVTKADYEDDKDATRGTKVQTEIVSVNGQNNVKDINSRKPGTYIVKYKAIDSQGKESGEIQLTVKVREDKPTPPTATAPKDGTVTVTPTGAADKVTVNYIDENNTQKTVTVVKAKNGTWSSPDKPAGVTVDSSTGALLIPEEGVRDKSQVTASATKGDSHPSEPTTVTAQQRDFEPVVPDKTPVTKVTSLTPQERENVKAKVQARNPGKNISISEDGTATLTDPKTNISHQISGDKLVESNDKVRPTVEIPYDNANKQEVYVYSGETNNITIKVKDNSGKISKSYLVFAANDRRGLGTEDNSYLGGGSSNGLYLTATKIHSDTSTSENQPATITVSGNLNNQPFTGEKSITRYVFAEDPSGNTNYDHVGHADDTGALGRVKFVWKSQTSKYDATANPEKQTVSYGDTPDAGTSINKTGLPTGTQYAWATTPSTTTGPGEKAGVVTVTYPDGSKDTVNVTVNVRKLSDEYNVTGTEIVVNQDALVSNEDLKAKVTAVAVKGNANGTDKISTVVPKSTISTANYGDQIISATVTFKDGTMKDVTIPLKVKDVTKPTIQSPADNTNWEMTALDKTLPNMEVRAEDNANGSGIKLVSVTGLPDYLEYDKTTNSIKFKAGKQEVEKLPTGTQSKEFSLTIQAEDNVGNISERTAKIIVSSMSNKYAPQPKVQTVDNGAVPEARNSIGNVDGLPTGTTFTWKDNTPPNTAVDHPGEVDGKVVVHYPDGTSEEVPVKVNVKGQADTYAPQPKVQTVDNGAVPEARNSIGNVDSLPPKTTFEWKDGAPNTAVGKPGEVSGTVIVGYPDGTSEEVPVKVNVRQSNEKGIPEVQLVLPEFAGGVNAPDSPSRDIPEYTDPVGTSSTDGEGNEITPPTVEIPEYTDPVGTSSTDGEGNEITPPTIEIPEYTDPVGTSSTDGEGNEITPPTAEIPEYTDPVGTSSTDGEGNEITPPIVEIPEYTDPVGTSSTDGEGNEITPPTVEIPEYTDPVGTSSTDGEGNIITPPTVEIPEYTDPVGTSSTDGEGNEITPPTVEIPEYTDPVGTSSTDGEGNEITPPTAEVPEYTGGVNGGPEAQQTLPEFNGGVNGDLEAQPMLPEFNGGVNGEPEAQQRLPEFNGRVNGDPEVQPALPEFNGGVNGDPEVQPTFPEYTGGVNGEPEVQAELPKYVGKSKDESEIRSSFRDKTSNVATKRLANTGQSQNNSELAGLGLVIVGLFAAIKRRKNEEE